MFNRITLLAIFSMLILGLAACAAEQPAPEEAEPAAEATPAPEPEPEGPYYELTSDDITTNPGWTSSNIMILGAKLGDTTRNVEKNFGPLDNTRTLAEDYLTVYQNNGLFVYTFKLTGKARSMEVYETFASKIKDANIKRLLERGDQETMRSILGQEEGVEENAEDMATEYIYDSRGIRFVRYKVGDSTINAIRFSEIRRSAT